MRKSAPTRAAVTNGPNLCHRPQEQATDQVVEALLLQVVGDLGALVTCKRKAKESAPVRERRKREQRGGAFERVFERVWCAYCVGILGAFLGAVGGHFGRILWRICLVRPEVCERIWVV